MKRITALLLVTAMILTLFAGCGSNNQPQATAAAANNPTMEVGSAAEVDVVAKGDGTAEHVIRDSITVGVQSDPADFAPWAANSNGRTNALWGLYQELGHIISGEFVPAIVKEYTIAEDGKSMTCTIFDYITDSAGNKLTANDVKFSFETGTALGYITGVSMIDEIVVDNDYQFTFKFGKELRLGDLDTIFRTAIVTQAAYEADPNGMSTNPVGTGPYTLTSYTAGSSFTYTAREDFWQTDENYLCARDRANVKTINYVILAESSQRTMALEQKSIDMCSEISNEDIGEFREGGAYSGDYWTYGVPDNLSLLIFCNCDSSRLTSNKDLRTAIFYAINAETILQSVYNGNGTNPKSMSPTWGTGYAASVDSEDNYYNYSVDKAKEYLEKAGYNGEELTILTEATGNVANSAVLVQAFLSAAGINAKIQSVDSTILQATYTNPDGWDILLTQNACNTYAVTAFNPLSSDRYTTGTINHIYDDKLQELLATAYAMSTAGEESFKALHDYVVENAYGMNLVNYTTTYVVPSFMDSVCLSYKKSFIPGGCTYIEQ
jgi:ABC-type transport system substrate-binding protein